nr:MAG TPA: hypothetical protein [Caudoviricetes sp.]
MATLSSNFKVFYFPKESGFGQFYNDHPEIKQIRALILEAKGYGHFALTNDAEFTNFVTEHKVPYEVKLIRLHQVLVEKVAYNPDPDIEYRGVHFTYEDNPDVTYFIAGPRYQLEATNKDLLSETLASNIQKVIWFTNVNNEYIMNDISEYISNKQS